MPALLAWRRARVNAAICSGRDGLRSLLLPQVVCVDSVLIAQEEVAAGDDRMRPRRQRVLRDAEASLLDVGGRVGLEEPYHAVLAQGVEHPVGEDERALADPAVTPRDPARVEADRRQDAAREAVHVFADEDGAAVVVAHLLRKVDL